MGKGTEGNKEHVPTVGAAVTWRCGMTVTNIAKWGKNLNIFLYELFYGGWGCLLVIFFKKTYFPYHKRIYSTPSWKRPRYLP
jgi:hypothetical protein